MITPFTQQNKSRLTFPSFFFFLWCLAIVTHNDGRGLHLAFDSYFFSTVLAYTGLCFSSSAYVILAVLFGQIITAWIHMPIIDNHYFFMSIVSIVLSVTVIKTILENKGRLDTSIGSADLVLPTVRWLILLLYFFAVFHKLNFGFFDTEKSCMITWINKLNYFSLIFHPPEISSIIVRKIFIISILAVELLIPLCLMRRKLWWLGLIFGVLFHLSTHVRHFPITMFAIYFLFIPSETRQRLIEFLDRLFRKISFKYLGLIQILQLQAILYTLFSLFIFSLGMKGSLYIENSWMIFTFAIFLISIKYILQHERKTINPQGFLHSKWKPHLIILALFFFNCMSPYTGLKTSTSMAMYSNLNTVFHRSNHILIGEDTLKIFDLLDEFVIIRWTNVESWQDQYVKTNTPIHITDLQKEIELISRASRSKILLEYVFKEKEFRTLDAAHDPQLMKPKSYLYRKFIGIHAYQPDIMPSCQWL